MIVDPAGPAPVAADEEPAPPLRLPRWATADRAEQLLWAVPIVGLTVLAITHRWTSDGGFLYLRVVEQLLAGNGPLFNDGQRVEVVASPAWTAVLAAGDVVLPLRLEYVAACFGVLLAVAGLVLATRASATVARLARPASRRIPLGLLTLGALWPVWVWTTGGTEVALAWAWLGTCFFTLTRWATRRRDNNGGSRGCSATELALLGAGWLVRPELAVASVVYVGLVVVVTTKQRRRRWRMIAVAAAAPVVYQVFRMGYYGMTAPASAVASRNTSWRAGLGWDYLRESMGPYLLVLPLAAIAFGVAGPLIRDLTSTGEHRVAAAVLAMCASGLACGAVVVLTGGGGVHFRLLLPPLFALLAPFFVVPAAGRSVEALVAVAVWAAVCVLVLRPDPSDTVASLAYVDGGLTINDRGYQARGVDQPWIHGPGIYVSDGFGLSGLGTGVAPADPDEVVVVTGVAGPLGYALGTGATVIDTGGAGDPVLARTPPSDRSTVWPPWIAADVADNPGTVWQDPFLAAQPALGDTPLTAVQAVAWAEAVNECETVERLRDAAEGEITLPSVLSRLWRSPATTSQWLAGDPRNAFTTLCDGHPGPVIELSERAARVDQLPETASAGDVAVIGRCHGVFFGTDDPARPWVAADAAAHQAVVTVEPTAPAGSVTIFELGPYGPAQEARATAYVELDGAGRYRIGQSLTWFPSTVQQWAPIPDSGAVGIVYRPDLDWATWDLVVGYFELASLPMFAVDGGGGAVFPTPPDPGDVPAGVSVTYPPVEASASCLELLDPLATIR